MAELGEKTAANVSNTNGSLTNMTSTVSSEFAPRAYQPRFRMPSGNTLMRVNLTNASSTRVAEPSSYWGSKDFFLFS